MAKYPSVSIIIVNFKRAHDTVMALESIRKLDYPSNRIQIILVDNLPEPASLKMIKGWVRGNAPFFLDITYLQNKKNVGLSLALNQALEVINDECEYIWRFDNDALADSKALKSLVHTIASDKNIGFVGSAAYDYNNHDKFTDGGWKINFWLGYAFLQKNNLKPVECDYVAGRSQFFMTKVAQQIGYIADPMYFAYFEDVDFCVQVKRLGYKILYDPSSIIYHRYEPAGEIAPYKIRLMTRNRILFMRKNASLIQRMFFISLFSIFGTLAFLLFLVRRNQNVSQIPNLLKVFGQAWVEGIFIPLKTPNA